MQTLFYVLKEYLTPKLLSGSVKFRDLDRESKNEALRDASFRIIIVAIFPILCEILVSFAVGAGSGMVLNELVIWMTGSEVTYRKFRRASALFGGSSIFGLCTLISYTQLVCPTYRILGMLLGIV
uniref:Uncharacterized protein n=1 Tax=Caenorhabditis japonica TaxID=281687 RepID=A0A8R1INH6_CAEJA